MMNRVFCSVAAALLCAGVATAQFCTTGATTVELRLNGQVPDTKPGHVCDMLGGDLAISVTDGAGFRPFALLTGALTPSGLALPAGLGCGALDLAAPTIVLDGIFLSAGAFDSWAVTEFQVTVTVAAPSSGYSSPGFQVLYFDPAGSPFPYGITQAGKVEQPSAISTTYAFTTNDDVVAHTLSTNTINFYGTNYTNFGCSDKGYISMGFNPGFVDFSATTADLFAGVATAGTPTVAVMWADMDYMSTPGTLTVTENLSTGATTFRYDNMSFSVFNPASGQPAGSFEVTFDGVGGMSFDHSQLLAGGAGDVKVCGWSNADANGANNTVGLTFGYVSPVPGSFESIGQQNAGGALPNYATFNGAGIWQAIDVTGTGDWVIF